MSTPTSTANTSVSLKLSMNFTQTNGIMDLSGNTSNISYRWETWIKQFKYYLTATGLEGEGDKRKVAILLSLIGPQAVTVFNSFNADADTIKYKDLVQLFANHFNPKNITVERHNFLTRRQKDNETLDEFVTDLKNLSLTCEFGILQNSLIKDLLICGLNKSNLFMKERLLQEDDLTLDRALKIWKSLELSQGQAQALLTNEDNNVYSIQSGSRNYRQPGSGQSRNRHQFTASQNQGHERQRTSSFHSTRSYNNNDNSGGQRGRDNKHCQRCGQQHRYKCPALKGVQNAVRWIILLNIVKPNILER